MLCSLKHRDEKKMSPLHVFHGRWRSDDGLLWVPSLSNHTGAQHLSPFRKNSNDSRLLQPRFGSYPRATAPRAFIGRGGCSGVRGVGEPAGLDSVNQRPTRPDDIRFQNHVVHRARLPAVFISGTLVMSGRRPRAPVLASLTQNLKMMS